MPIYEYKCESCGERFEFIQKFTDKPKEDCPRCGGTLRKLISRSAVKFKGTGWYVTDYGRSKTRKAEGDVPADSSNGSDVSAPKTKEAGGES